jgi:glyoxylase-like metal-dependent hydrolase (beta-lactamase superfamily II)
MNEPRLYFRQLLAGRDFARDDTLARQMVNFSYLIGDRASGTCVVVDPAYAVGELVDLAAGDGMTIDGVLVTHYHPDHVGGSMAGYRIEGLRELLDLDVAAKVHVQAEEAWGTQRVTGLSASDLVEHASGDVVHAGDVAITLLHTPGHTPGSQCFLVAEPGEPDKLVSGDTLFLDGCGRTDLPGGDADQLYDSVHTKLAVVADDAWLYPGHLYSPEPSAPMGVVRERNYVFRFRTREQWNLMFGDG